ncbi:type II toxin-antitoxin system prevent-host-death family antitoxin [Streptomyces sp. NPDC005969]|uniref:type II toxin-antitoxin system Phd/YefM family antitoxin n=1 Tax=Streptomyces sp. NPDC005969 TaxID=3156722 RepID=UPI0033F904ED
MEKSYGIEAARAQLGEIADHVRTTGQVINLTRHGRPVATIGPAEVVQPAQGVEVLLHFPHRAVGSRTRVPAIPRTGDIVGWEEGFNDHGEWRVVRVEWSADDSGELAVVGLILEPADDLAEQKASETTNETTEQ